MRSKYVVHGIVYFWCLNLQTLSCIHQAQRFIFHNFEFLKKQAFLCLLGAYYFVRQYIYLSCQTYFSLVKKYLKVFSAGHLEVRLFSMKYATQTFRFLCGIFCTGNPAKMTKKNNLRPLFFCLIFFSQEVIENCSKSISKQLKYFQKTYLKKSKNSVLFFSKIFIFEKLGSFGTIFQLSPNPV